MRHFVGNGILIHLLIHAQRRSAGSGRRTACVFVSATGPGQLHQRRGREVWHVRPAVRCGLELSNNLPIADASGWHSLANDWRTTGDRAAGTTPTRWRSATAATTGAAARAA